MLQSLHFSIQFPSFSSASLPKAKTLLFVEAQPMRLDKDNLFFLFSFLKVPQEMEEMEECSASPLFVLLMTFVCGDEIQQICICCCLSCPCNTHALTTKHCSHCFLFPNTAPFSL